MQASDICAVVVTFHPDSAIQERLHQLRQQVGGVVVVDNGSSPSELLAIERSIADAGCPSTLLKNDDNLGIATALNQGVTFARDNAFPLVALFDQDSRITEGFFSAMLGGFETSRWTNRLGILVPRYTDSRLGTPLPPNRVTEGLEAAMTSGSLQRTALFAQLGMFVDELFIDGVDYEFSLRLRRAGYVIDECVNATLLHAPGEPRRLKLFGLLNYQTANYSPARHYYQQRNKVWIARHYFLAFPVFCLKLAKFSIKDFFKILFGESDKLRKIRFFLRGVWHGLRGCLGPMP